MPSPIIAIDLIKTAMRLKGIIATGETPSADDAQVGLRALNDVLETWSIQSYAVWGGVPETFALVAGKSLYTIGAGGDWETDRPVSIGGAYTSLQGADFPLQPWTLEQYMGTAFKAQTGGIPERITFINDAPLARVQLYPVPSADSTITINLPRLLSQVASVASTLTLPPGYARALQYAVAEELGPQYGSPIDLSAAARSSLAFIKRANRSSPISSFDPALLQGYAGGAGGGLPAVVPVPVIDEWSATQW